MCACRDVCDNEKFDDGSHCDSEDMYTLHPGTPQNRDQAIIDVFLLNYAVCYFVLLN